MISKNKNKTYIAKMYIRHKLAKQGIITLETEKSLGFELLTDSMSKLTITSALMANHKTIKNSNEYNYNFWEFKIPEKLGDFLICVCFENFDKKLKENGCFVFPNSVIEQMKKSKTINIFESDISGNYSKTPRNNKFIYFENWQQLTKQS